jgi:hypothetical protein
MNRHLHLASLGLAFTVMIASNVAALLHFPTYNSASPKNGRLPLPGAPAGHQLQTAWTSRIPIAPNASSCPPP